ncbi:MAG: hypothetical protein GX101_04605 [Firmicutes bacterium]|nr:hypothetical protein [Bacillota bacterium]NLO65954.1 hypothetical protein [Bacillota bacterium]
MKKYASMSLMLVLVLVLGATAFAVEGPPSPLLKDTIPIEATIGAYAQVLVVSDGIFFDLEGKAGEFDSLTNGVFTVEANCDVKLTLTLEDNEWVPVPYKFLVEGYEITKSNASVGWNQLYAKGVKEYTVKGWIEIPSISSIAAGDYETVIEITVEEL